FSFSLINCSSSLFFIAAPSENQFVQTYNITTSARVVDSDAKGSISAIRIIAQIASSPHRALVYIYALIKHIK
ncbi:hypothetical protein QP311_25940, partial [Escherichia coli]|nr:hypothetical protein [Escherichia coli]